MNRFEAAKFLGVSEKTVSRYVAAGRFGQTAKDKKTGALDITEAQALKLKTELETPVLTAREVETGRDISALVPVPRAIARRSYDALASIETTTGQRETGRDRPFVPTADKLLLSLDEASALTGLSPARLRAAIGEEKLVARKVGRAWKMRRGDLTAFVDAIFEEGN